MFPLSLQTITITRISLTSARQHPSYGDHLEVKRECYQNCSELDCVTQCSQSAAHLCEHFLLVKQIGFVTLGPLRCAQGQLSRVVSCYCNMVEWFQWDLSLISKTNQFPSMTYNVWSVTLSLYTTTAAYMSCALVDLFTSLWRVWCILQDLASLRVDEGTVGSLTVLGHVRHKLLCIPDLTTLLHSGHSGS